MSFSIYRGTVQTDSKSHGEHRIKVLVPGIWEDKSQIPYVESVNGIYLRKNEEVYLLINDTYDSGIVIGRMKDWLNAEELTALFNSLIDEINNTRQSLRDLMDDYGKHTHGGVYTGACFTTPQSVSSGTYGGKYFISKVDVPRDMKKIKVDDVIHKG